MKLPLDRVLIGDCVAELEKLPANSVDVIFADPPYNLQLAGELHRPITPASMASMPRGTVSRKTRTIRSPAFPHTTPSPGNGWPPLAAC